MNTQCNYQPDEGSQYRYDAALEKAEALNSSFDDAVKEATRLVVKRMAEYGFLPSDNDSVEALSQWIADLFDKGE